MSNSIALAPFLRYISRMTFSDLKEWFERDLRPTCLQRRWKIDTQESDTELTWVVTTAKHLYTITAKPDWLGCTMQTRFMKGGHPLFADLPDGGLTEGTWREIVAAVRQMEIQPYRGRGI
jgi:hypothetical protein